MPFFRTENQLVYYAHVPKCGGSAIARYLEDRFGPLGFYDDSFHKKRARKTAWSATSPQHVDAGTLESLLPATLFDAMFAVVRHPVPRSVSTYHFQCEVEGRIPADLSFSDWLARLEAEGFAMFAYDNHILPMTMLVPEGATVFHLEHGLDPLVVWLDLLSGQTNGSRVIMPENARGALVAATSGKVVPTDADIACIGRIYAADFARFGYRPDRANPVAPAPRLTADFVVERDRAIRAMQHPVARLRQRLQRRLRRM